jgi:hypothetical protein
VVEYLRVFSHVGFFVSVAAMTQLRVVATNALKAVQSCP